MNTANGRTAPKWWWIIPALLVLWMVVGFILTDRGPRGGSYDVDDYFDDLAQQAADEWYEDRAFEEHLSIDSADPYYR